MSVIQFISISKPLELKVFHWAKCIIMICFYTILFSICKTILTVVHANILIISGGSRIWPTWSFCSCVPICIIMIFKTKTRAKRAKTNEEIKHFDIMYIIFYLLHISFTVFVHYILLTVRVYCVCTHVLLSACGGK